MDGQSNERITEDRKISESPKILVQLCCQVQSKARGETVQSDCRCSVVVVLARFLSRWTTAVQYLDFCFAGARSGSQLSVTHVLYCIAGR
jgi:hypothetical protein